MPRELSPRELDEAIRLYRSLHWGAPAPPKPTTWLVPDPDEGPLVEMGALVAVEYWTHKKGDPPSVYRHRFGKKDGSRCPILVVNGERKLIIAGGYYSVTRRGIVG